MNIYHIGIDPGVNTGIAIVKDGELIEVATCNIIAAMKKIMILRLDECKIITIHVENPNFRKYFGKSGPEMYQGAGSIKRDYSIWQSFCDEYPMEMVPVPPAAVGSQFDNVKIFEAATGWKGRTSKHARDAAKIVFKFIKK